MPAFSYQAFNSDGKIVKGLLEGDSERQVRSQLRSRQLKPIKVLESAEKITRPGVKLGLDRFFKPRVSQSQLTLITRQIATLVQSNVPLDEALSRVVIDFSGRPGMEYGVDYTRARVGDFDMDLLSEFFQGFINHAQVTLHIDNIRGKNAHHIAETVFKAFGRAVRMALEMDSRMGDTLPSTKGSL